MPGPGSCFDMRGLRRSFGERSGGAGTLSALCSPYAVLMEVTQYPPYGMEERLKIRNAVKNVHPDCKVVLVVDENSETEAADRVRQAKKDGLIDQFIYGSTSPAYLVALMDTL